LKLALWTPDPRSGWARALSAQRGAETTLVSGTPDASPDAELDLYHLANAPAHGFAYRALLERPGIVLLAEWRLDALVYAETAGRGDAAGYRREARHAHGDTGVFVARQVLAGLGGALPRLLAMNQRVLDASLAVAAWSEEIRARAAALVPERRVIGLPADDAGRASALLALVAEVAPHAASSRRAADARLAEKGPRARTAAELRVAARELGLAEPPAGATRLVDDLFGARR